MRCALPLLSVLVVCSMTASCASSTPPASAPPKPLPAASAAQCPPPVDAADSSADAVAVALKDMYDLYGLCAGRHVELVNYIEENHP